MAQRHPGDDPAIGTGPAHHGREPDDGLARLPVATIGFTRSSAEDFFRRLAQAGVKRVIDVRLNNTSQLSGFAKAGDLAWFLDRLAGIDYRHETALAPTADLLRDLQGKRIDWATYETSFLALMAARSIETRLDPALFDGACLLCSEHVPHHCHRRLVCDYLGDRWGGRLEVRHL